VADRVAGAQAAIALLDRDPRLRKKIFAHAYSLTRNLEDAKDLSQAAIAKAIDPEGSPWDPDAQPNLLLYVGSLMNTAAFNKRRGEARHPTVGESVLSDHRPGPDAEPEPTPEERLAHAEDLARLEGWLDKLLVRLAGDEVALAKIELMRDGIDDAAEQAARIGCSVKDTYRANERIAYHAALVKKTAREGERPARSERTTGGGAGSTPVRPKERP
jgi:DNA-directed RNA polymerase specialized sigma24 family protein